MSQEPPKSSRLLALALLAGAGVLFVLAAVVYLADPLQLSESDRRLLTLILAVAALADTGMAAVFWRRS